MKFASLFLLAVLLWTSLAVAEPTTVPIPQTTQNAPTTKSWPTLGFSLVLPPQWEIADSSPVGHTHVLGLFKNEAGQVERAFKVEIGEFVKEDLLGAATLVAEDGNGKVLDNKAQLDGKPAVKIELHDDSFALEHQAAIISKQGKQTFTIIFATKKSEDLTVTQEFILTGWKWQPFAAPWQHLELREQTLVFQNAKLSLKIPKIMRVVPTYAFDTMLVVDDLQTGTEAFTLITSTISGPNKLQLKQMREQFEKGVRSQLKISKPLQWSELRNGVPRTFSAPFTIPKSIVGKQYPVYDSYGLVKLSPNDWAIFTFTIAGQSPQARKAYTEALNKIVASITLKK